MQPGSSAHVKQSASASAASQQVALPHSPHHSIQVLVHIDTSWLVQVHEWYWVQAGESLEMAETGRSQALKLRTNSAQ